MLNVAHRHDLWDPLCFFLTSVGYTIGWTAISSMLASYKQQFGPAILLQLNVAYFLPSIPVLFLQTRCDARFNRRFGLPQTIGLRMIVGLGGAGIICGLFPFVRATLGPLLSLTTLLGLCCGIAFGSSYQLVSRFESTCNVALTIGFVGSGPIVLFLEVADRIGPHPTQPQRILLYSVVVPFFTFIGLGAAVMLLQWHGEGLLRAGKLEGRQLGVEMEAGASLLGADSEQVSSSDSRSLTPAGSDELRETAPQGPGHLSGGAQHRLSRHSELSSSMQISGRQLAVERAATDPGSDWQLAAEVWPAALALAVSVCCATLFFPFFTYCPSSGHLQALLPQVLFFTRTGSDIIGRFVPPAWLRLDTRYGLHAMTISKVLALPLGFWYITSAPVRSDALAVAYVGLFWLQCGIVNSASFVMANKWASPPLRERAAGFLALVFQVACLVALSAAFLIYTYCDAFRSDWVRE